jgi:hypothetical protein
MTPMTNAAESRCRRAARAWFGLCLAIAGTGVPVRGQDLPAFPEPPVQRLPAPADPLEPWSLEAAPATLVLPAAAPFDSLGPLPMDAPIVAPTDEAAIAIARCRYVMVSTPAAARQLSELLHAGVTFEAARTTLALDDVVDTTRDYAVEDLVVDIRAAIESLPDSAWTEPLAWRGRPMLVQVLSRQQRPRSTIPELGKALGPQEQERVAQLKSRLRAANAEALQREGDEPDAQPARVVDQAQPEYPTNATTDGTVTLIVEVGRLNEAYGIRVESASDPVFEEAAIAAARKSTYQAATRNGVVEPGTVRLTYRFQAPTPGGTQPPGSEP